MPLVKMLQTLGAHVCRPMFAEFRGGAPAWPLSKSLNMPSPVSYSAFQLRGGAWIDLACWTLL